MEIALETPFRLPRPSGAATMRAVSTNELTDAELIIRTGDGDRGAFEALYRRYSRPVFGLALRRLGDRGRAEDAVQETFASIWRAARTYKPERGHELLVAAGPPPELPPAIADLSGEPETVVVLPRRRAGAMIALAAAIALVAFVGGYAAAHHGNGSFTTFKSLPMHGTAAAQ